MSCQWTWHSKGPIFHFYHCREHPCFVLNGERVIITISLGDDAALVSSTLAGIFVNGLLLMTATHPSARSRRYPIHRSSPCSIKLSVPLTYVNNPSYYLWAILQMQYEFHRRKCIIRYDMHICIIFNISRSIKFQIYIDFPLVRRFNSNLAIQENYIMNNSNVELWSFCYKIYTYAWRT